MLKTQKCVHDMMVALDLPLPNEDRPGLVDLNFSLLRNLVHEESQEFDVAMGALEGLRLQQANWRNNVMFEVERHQRGKGEGSDKALLTRFQEMSDSEFHQSATFYWWAEVIDAICDITVVIHNTSNAMGIDIEPFFDAVHKANMTKADGPLRDDGKRLKPEGWKPPPIEIMLRNLLATGEAKS